MKDNAEFVLSSLTKKLIFKIIRLISTAGIAEKTILNIFIRALGIFLPKPALTARGMAITNRPSAIRTPSSIVSRVP